MYYRIVIDGLPVGVFLVLHENLWPRAGWWPVLRCKQDGQRHLQVNWQYSLGKVEDRVEEGRLVRAGDVIRKFHVVII